MYIRNKIMRNPRKTLLHFIVLGLFLFCITTAASAQNAEQIAKKALAATVSLEMTDRSGQPVGWGSGFFVRQNQIATNFHVIAGATHGTAQLGDKPTRYAIEKVIETDQDNDLAILEVALRSIQPLPLGDSDAVRIGQTVYVTGNPMELSGTFSNGIISNVHESDAGKRIQMTAPISPGSSGGPVLNENGEVIGIAYMTIETGQNLNFAIPSNYLKRLFEQPESEKPVPTEQPPLSAETYNKRGQMMYSIELYYEAIVEYNKAIRSNPDFALAYSNRGAAKNELGRHEEAIVDCDQAIRLDPQLYLAYNNRGFAKAKLGRHEEAIVDYDQAIRLNPLYATGYVNRGAAKNELGRREETIVDMSRRYEEAIVDYDQAIRLDPRLALAYSHRGYAKHILGRDEEAIVDYDQAIRLDPSYALAYNDRGASKAQLRRPEEALADFDQAIRLDPRLAPAYDNRGSVMVVFGRYEEALADFDQAIRLDPSDALSYANRGVLKHMIGDNSGARYDLARASILARYADDRYLMTLIEESRRKID